MIPNITQLAHPRTIESLQSPNLSSAEPNLGYGLGRISRIVFDALNEGWKKLYPPPDLANVSTKTNQKRGVQQALSFPAIFDLRTLSGANGFQVNGLATNDHLGDAAERAGDINGDGIEDLVIGAPWALNKLGSVYVLFGKQDWTSPFALNSLNGNIGFRIDGTFADGWLGAFVSSAGDINGDNITDLMVSAQLASPGLYRAGVVYIIFGHKGIWPHPFDLNTLNGTNGFSINGLTVNANLGCDFQSLGDINGDGRDDIILGALGTNNAAGAAYVLFGKNGSWAAQFDLSTLDGSNGFSVNGLNPGDYLGRKVGSAGNLNADARQDLFIGASQASYNGLTTAGAVYILFGSSSAWTAQFDLNSLSGTNGFVIYATQVDESLIKTISSAQDFNCDSKDDLILGGSTLHQTEGVIYGAVYILFGQADWPSSFNLTLLNGTNGLRVNSLAPNDYLGSALSGTMDVNNDGKDDLILGAYGAGGSQQPGAAYVIFGHEDPWPASFNLSLLNGANGFTVNGLKSVDQLGFHVNSAGDINGDLSADLVISARDLSSQSRGTVYIIFGKTNRTIVRVPSPLVSPVIPPSAEISVPTPVSALPPSSVLFPTPDQSPTPSLFPTPAIAPSMQPSSTPIEFSNSPSNMGFSTAPGGLSSEQVQNIGIGVGVGGALLIGALGTIIGVLKKRRKACFAKQNPSIEDGPRGPDQELFIAEKELEIKQKIAEGGFGTVFKGNWRNVAVAIKELKPQLSITAQEKFLEEIGIMSKLHSPYVVGFYGVTKEQPYKIVMQFMQGGALREFLKKRAANTVQWGLRFQIGHDICQGLKYLHDRKIVHADLKSPNVLLDDLNHARLADFGLASIKSENAAQLYQDNSQIKGSLLWMAPELFEKSRHTFATDIYSLGIVLWELATHRLPFENKPWELKELIDHTVQGEREEFPETTPLKYKKLAQKCWDGVPYQRPDAEEGAKTLFDLWTHSQNSAESTNEVQMEGLKTIYPTSYMENTQNIETENNKPTYHDTKTKFGI